MIERAPMAPPLSSDTELPASRSDNVSIGDLAVERDPKSLLGDISAAAPN